MDFHRAVTSAESAPDVSQAIREFVRYSLTEFAIILMEWIVFALIYHLCSFLTNENHISFLNATIVRPQPHFYLAVKNCIHCKSWIMTYAFSGCGGSEILVGTIITQGAEQRTASWKWLGYKDFCQLEGVGVEFSGSVQRCDITRARTWRTKSVIWGVGVVTRDYSRLASPIIALRSQFKTLLHVSLQVPLCLLDINAACDLYSAVMPVYFKY